MTLEGSQSFAAVIEAHLELKRRNAALEREMPLARYRNEDPFQNHPLFKSEEQARLEETLAGEEPLAEEEELVLAWPVAEETDPAMERAEGEDSDNLWGRSREFDWGD